MKPFFVGFNAQQKSFYSNKLFLTRKPLIFFSKNEFFNKNIFVYEAVFLYIAEFVFLKHSKENKSDCGQIVFGKAENHGPWIHQWRS